MCPHGPFLCLPGSTAFLISCTPSTQHPRSCVSAKGGALHDSGPRVWYSCVTSHQNSSWSSRRARGPSFSHSHVRAIEPEPAHADGRLECAAWVFGFAGGGRER